MSISRNYTWVDDSQEHSDEDEQRAAALARRWSAIQSDIEGEQFSRQGQDEEGGFEPEPNDCPTCGGERRGLGFEHRYYQHLNCAKCHFVPGSDLYGIECPDCRGAGYDVKGEAEHKKAMAARDADRNLEVELIEDKLAAIGARMMRPYEHWNEDERLMEYLERER